VRLTPQGHSREQELNVVYLHQYFRVPSEPGGGRSYEFARRLVERGHQVYMVTSDRRASTSAPRWSVTEEAGIQVHWVHVPYSGHMGYRARMRAFATYAIQAAQRATRLPADVVLATSTPLTIAIPGVWASRRQHVPMVLEVRDLWPDVPIALGVLRDPARKAAARWLESFAYRNATRVIALSPGMRDGVIRRDYPAQHVSVIPNACDLATFAVSPEAGQAYRHEHSWLGGRPLVAYAGALGLVNGVGYLVRVAAEMSRIDPEVRFLIVGDGHEAGDIRGLANQLGVLNHTLFLEPPVARTQMPAILSAADVATSTVIDVPALWNNSANKFFDGLAAGRPIAINYEGWQADLLRSSGAGLVLPANDHHEAARLLAAFVRDRSRLDAAGRAARRLAETRFDRDTLFDEFERVLVDAAGR